LWVRKREPVRRADNRPLFHFVTTEYCSDNILDIDNQQTTGREQQVIYVDFAVLAVRYQKIVDSIVTNVIKHALQSVAASAPTINQPGDKQ
jgi:hypothetical protein